MVGEKSILCVTWTGNQKKDIVLSSLETLSSTLKYFFQVTRKLKTKDLN